MVLKLYEELAPVGAILLFSLVRHSGIAMIITELREKEINITENMRWNNYNC